MTPDSSQSPPKPVTPTHCQREFTARAVVTGVVLGAIFSACNVYVGLKTGTALGTSLVAALLGFGVWSTFTGVFPRLGRWGILENNISQTACSSAASVASAGLVAPIPALALLTGQTLAWHSLAIWLLSVMLVGIVVAIPLRRQLLEIDELPFAPGVATAEMLSEIHWVDTSTFSRIVAFITAGVVGVANKLGVGALAAAGYPVSWSPPFSLRGISAGALTFTLSPSLLFVGVGGLVGFRICCSLIIGAVLAYGVIAPAAIRENVIEVVTRTPLASLPPEVHLAVDTPAELNYDEKARLLCFTGAMSERERAVLFEMSEDATFRSAIAQLYQQTQSPRPTFREMNRWLLWPGVTLMVVGSLISLAFSWRSFLPLARRRNRRLSSDFSVEPARVARRWFWIALALVTVVSVTLQVALFGIGWWLAVIGVVLTFALAVVAGRVAGETGLGAVGPMGKVTQLIFGLVSPSSPVPNLMAANVTGGAASQCADLLNDLKCGKILGASPRWQTVAQICGAVAGALVGSAVYLLLIPNPVEMIGSDEWAAPAANSWLAVAKLFQVGLDALPRGTQDAIWAAAIGGALLEITQHFAPRNVRGMIPSSVSIGLAFVLPAPIAILMFIGGLLALLLRVVFKDWTARFLVVLCAGVIAGESLTGIGVALKRVMLG